MQLFPGELEDLLLILVSFAAGTAIGFVALRSWRAKLDSTALFQQKHPVLTFSRAYFSLFFLLALVHMRATPGSGPPVSLVR